MSNHAIIIGSGLSGLVSAYILSKNGLRVTVLEKSNQYGGCLQTFIRKGVKFETGMHYIGSMAEGEALHRLFNYLNLLNDVPLRQLDPSAYDIVSILDRRYSIPNGEETFNDAMLTLFPKDKAGLQSYWNAINDATLTSPLTSYLRNNSFTPLNHIYATQSASAFIDATITTPRLRQILSANAPLYAGVRNATNLYTHALIRSFYNNDAHRIIGGSDAIAHSLAASVKRHGGEIITNAEVSKINTCADRAVSLTLSNGQTLHADRFLSTIHPARTMELLDTPLIRKSYRQRIIEMPNTISNFTVYITFKPNQIPYLNSNFFHYNDEDIWSMASHPRPLRQYLYMHLASEPNQQYARAAVIITYMDYKEVEKWAHTQPNRRGKEYEDFKQQKAEALIQDLENQFPELRHAIESTCTSSPLTYRNYTGTEKGSTYGILHNSSKLIETTLPSRTKLRNLHLAGQSIYPHGILGVITGAIFTANEIINPNK